MLCKCDDSIMSNNRKIHPRVQSAKVPTLHVMVPLPVTLLSLRSIHRPGLNILSYVLFYILE